MTTALYTHESCLRHDPGRGHPESPDRLKVVLSALEEDSFSALARYEAPRATIEQIARIHPIDHVTQILEGMPEQGYARIDADTVVSPASGEAVLRAAGAVCAAVDNVVAGTVKNAFCAIRPPGHHAEPTIPMGFCVFNSIAVGAAQARSRHGMERIAVVDFDVHHGNGTQAAFQNDPNLFYASTHQSPLYPGTGSPRETGIRNNIVNAPLPPGAGSDLFREAMALRVLPALQRFAPEFLLVSAGFDAHRDDPLAGLRLTDDDYRWVTGELARVADICCGGRIVSALEGGYDLDALARCVSIHVQGLMQA